jgi:hypothetical protein
MKTIQYVATIPHVREVSILGTADLEFWTERLRTEKLVPLAVDGRAQILVIAADLRFLGVPFQEISFSVTIEGSGAFLVQAFNSRRFFAFWERNVFGTPYAFGDVQVSASFPASVQLTRDGEPLFRAAMGTATPEPGASPYQDGWEGPVFLPRRGRKSGRLFFARIRGACRPVGFVPSRDVLEIRPASGLPVFQALIDSRFEATQWLVRQDAVHAKSKTYDGRRFLPIG